MTPQEKQTLITLMQNLEKLTKQFNDFVSLYKVSHHNDKWVLTMPLVLLDDVIIQGQNGTRFGKNITDKLSFYGVDTTTQPPALTAQSTTITHSNPGTPDYAIQDLTQTTPYGFVTKDEGNTVLAVIKNLQTRVQELEDKLQLLGLIA